MSSNTPPTYWDYLCLDELLALQGGLNRDEAHLGPDELHFILVHQTLELWLKLILSEVRITRDHLAVENVCEEHIPYVVHHLGRVVEITKLMVHQFDVVETLTTRDFLGFRDKLVPASGFQSFQMRELEIVLGLREEDRVKLGSVSAMKYLEMLAAKTPGGANAWGQISAAQTELPLRSALHDWLYRTPIDGSTPDQAGDDAAVESFITAYLESWQRDARKRLAHMIAQETAPEDALRERFQETFQAASAYLQGIDVDDGTRSRTRRIRAAIIFIESYRELPLLAWPRTLLDAVAELEQRLLIFRHRHARMAERLIGRRVGTGGSAGVDYLDQTTRYRIFKDLWAARTVLMMSDSLPPLENSESYGFTN